MTYERAKSIDPWIIVNLNALHAEYQDYRMRTLSDDEFFAFDEFCMQEYAEHTNPEPLELLT